MMKLIKKGFTEDIEEQRTKIVNDKQISRKYKVTTRVVKIQKGIKQKNKTLKIIDVPDDEEIDINDGKFHYIVKRDRINEVEITN